MDLTILTDEQLLIELMDEVYAVDRIGFYPVELVRDELKRRLATARETLEFVKRFASIHPSHLSTTALRYREDAIALLARLDPPAATGKDQR